MQTLDLITLDFETYYDQKYSLRAKEYNMSEYIRDPQFKIHCVGIKRNDEPVRWYRDRDVADALRSIQWDKSALLCHNTAFDGLILSHHFGIVPAYYFDTLSMARAVHSNALGAGLDEVATFYGKGNKLPNVLNLTKGIKDLDDNLMAQLAKYCAEDVRLCYEIFQELNKQYPQSELDLIDLTVRLFTDPVLRVDTDAVTEALDAELEERDELIARTGLAPEQLRSSNKFADALKALSVTPPTKVSERTGKDAYAFAKSDEGFMDLLEHEDERVRNLCEARLASKSTINETRAYRFLKAGADGMKLPVLLNYWGAHTGRWSAGNKMNMQNLPSARSKSRGALRKSILAPEGCVLVVADSAQIEVRVNAWLAGQTDMLQAFREGRDIYSEFATTFYGRTITNSEETKMERQVGKTAVLGLGYGMGAQKFQKSLKSGNPSVVVTDQESQDVTTTYRQTYRYISMAWRQMEGILGLLVDNQSGTWKVLKYEDSSIVLPNGMRLLYPGLTHTDDGYCYYGLTDHYRIEEAQALETKIHGNLVSYKIYGALLWENIIQALARIIIAEQMLIISKRYRVVMTTHDEIVAVAPKDEADEALQFMFDVMLTSPSWAPDLPLNASGGYAENYSK
jgi:DNA polymerase I-like protein with 3'-5' exonuclease and polymerase domains